MLNALRLRSLPEYDRLLSHLLEMRADLLEDALSCETMDKKERIRGKVEMIDYFVSVPDRLFTDTGGKHYAEEEEGIE